MLRDFSQSIRQNFMSPLIQHKFHDNKEVASIPFWRIEHGSLHWEPAIVTTI